MFFKFAPNFYSQVSRENSRYFHNFSTHLSAEKDETMQYVLAVDQGTTGTRALLVSGDCEIVCSSYKEHQQIYPRPGWVEHDPMEIWQNTLAVIKHVFEHASSQSILINQIIGIGIANQGETVMVWDRTTGLPFHNAIVWQCRRTAEDIERTSQRAGFVETIKEKTGLIPDAYFSASKIQWLLENIPETKNAIEENRLLAGTLDAWLIWNLTGGTSFFTDPSTASRTMLLNIHEQQWDNDLLELFSIPRSILPEIIPTNGQFGLADPQIFDGNKIPITGSIVDQQGALFGQGCFETGTAKCTFGTGCFLLKNTGQKPAQQENGLLTTIAWHMDGKTTFAIDGGVYIAGAAIQWLRDGLGIIENYEETEQMALSVKDNADVYFVPAFSGLAAPHWNPFARGTLVGITAATRKEHIVRATLEAIAYQVADIVDSMEGDIEYLRVDGGITKNNFLMQFQADILGIPVEVASVTETTALGAAIIAGLGCGLWKEKKELLKHLKISNRFVPQINKKKRMSLREDWKEAVLRSRNWANRKDRI
jgi:glycerol kinase